VGVSLHNILLSERKTGFQTPPNASREKTCPSWRRRRLHSSIKIIANLTPKEKPSCDAAGKILSKKQPGKRQTGVAISAQDEDGFRFQGVLLPEIIRKIRYSAV